MGGSVIRCPVGSESSAEEPSGTTPGPLGRGDSADPDAITRPADTPGPAGIGNDRASSTIQITSGIPTGVRDRRTAVYYARTHRMLRTYADLSNPDLIARADFLSRFLLGECSRFGPEAQSEFAGLLIDMEAEMTRRLREADLDQNALPVLEGFSWTSPDDPLAGIAEGIPPFGLLDVWTTFLLEPVPEARRQRRRRRGPVVRRRFPGVYIPPTPDPPRREDVITGTRLSVRNGSFAYWFLQNFTNQIISGRFSPNPSYVTRGGITRVAFAPPTTSEYTELRRIYLSDDTHQYATDDIHYFSRMKRELQRVVLAWVPVFSDRGSDQYQGERRWDLLGTAEYRAFRTVMHMNPPEINVPRAVRDGMRERH